jgi:hypothetical protein
MPARARARFRLSPESFRKVTNLPAVRAKCEQVAERIASSAVGIAAAEDVDTVVTVEIGTRPGGRGYARVSSSNVDAEHGTAATPRRRVLGRASGMPYNP